ncbi:class I SAM-dependent methyltransferase [Plantactinospora sp. ZYX-F-223]|uniref:class I SAM-dependent methyltransferase n=1 Tax=Plantactinospora sp. ZYX-F-223 TaxID=3144103 RepID=UPI0031FE29B4
MGGLLDDETLASSAVVANSAMNRERQLDGVNSYTRELGFHPLDWLVARVHPGDPAEPGGPPVGWLDLCCGSGRALGQAARRLHRAGLADRVAITGVDLVDFFDAAAPDPGPGRDDRSPVGVGAPHLVCAPIGTWTPPRRYDLITCVHGLHYVGDKLGMLTRIAGWLVDDGRFVADLDLSSVRLADGRAAGRRLSSLLRSAGFTVDPRRRRISRTGPVALSLPYRYLGADDRAGPNYTGQPAVVSYYAPA